MDANVVIQKGGEYPTYGKNVEIQADGSGLPTAGAMKLIDLMGQPYDSNMWNDLLDQLTWMDTVRLLSNGRHKTIAIASVSKPSTGDENGPNGYNTKYSKASAGSSFQGPTLPYAERIGDPDLGKGYSTTGFCSNGNLAATYNKEIAEKVGFVDEAYFCRCFRKYKGVPPSRYIAHQMEQGN
jgi:AraC-like DNA-binding protein